jgi:hypothetical protein
MAITMEGNRLVVDGRSIDLQWTILDAIEGKDRILVLFDPTKVHFIQGEKRLLRRPGPVIPNLIAIGRDGTLLWEAAYPQTEDHYYGFSSAGKLAANSFSPWRCEIDPDTGAIVSKVFFR